MVPNPYQPPGPQGPFLAQVSRTPFILAGAGALLASGYWALITLLVGLGAAFGGISALQVVLPVVLIALYAVRGWQILKGDARAAQRILWLHGIGGAMAAFQIMQGAAGVLVALTAIKIVIHIFGGVTAWMAWRSVAR
jgi:hypothetical protein